MEQSTEEVGHVGAADLGRVHSLHASAPTARRTVTEAAVRTALVVVLDVDAENANKLLAATKSNWSRHSRRTVPTQRSAMALGARTGVQIISTSVERQTSSNAVVNLASRSRITNLNAVASSLS
jgi:electron transfer flavoprotein alpha/beta subunit